jgi:hypothetical protein
MTQHKYPATNPFYRAPADVGSARSVQRYLKDPDLVEISAKTVTKTRVRAVKELFNGLTACCIANMISSIDNELKVSIDAVSLLIGMEKGKKVKVCMGFEDRAILASHQLNPGTKATGSEAEAFRVVKVLAAHNAAGTLLHAAVMIERQRSQPKTKTEIFPITPELSVWHIEPIDRDLPKLFRRYVTRLLLPRLKIEQEKVRTRRDADNCGVKLVFSSSDSNSQPHASDLMSVDSRVVSLRTDLPDAVLT